MEGGIVEKRADGLGVCSTISIYVKYPPMPLPPIFSIFGGFSCLFVVPAMLAETNKLFQLSFKYFHIFHCNILYFMYYHLLILPPYTFPLSITFPYTTLFPFYPYHPFYYLLFYPSCTLLYRFMPLYMFYWYLSLIHI